MVKVRCPTCQDWVEWKVNPFRPFCSDACKQKDLGRWATEQYRIPTVEQEEMSETAKMAPKSGEE